MEKMTGQELFQPWAPSDSAWSQWVSPALFAQIACTDGVSEAGVDVPVPTWQEEKASPESAVIVDLPGADSIRLAMALAKLGHRPVPIINASPGPVVFELNFVPQRANVAWRTFVVVDIQCHIRS